VIEPLFEPIRKDSRYAALTARLNGEVGSGQLAAGTRQ
jgi:hypothetical protein